MSIISFIFGAMFSLTKHFIPSWRDIVSFMGGMVFQAIYILIVNKIVYAQTD